MKTLISTPLLFLSLLIVKCNDKSNNNEIPPLSEKNEWELVFEENFNGNAVNTAEWGMYNSPGHAGNGLRRPEAFTVENGHLIVTAQMKDGEIVSGGMAHLKNYKFGKFEFRVRTEPDPS